MTAMPEGPRPRASSVLLGLAMSLACFGIAISISPPRWSFEAGLAGLFLGDVIGWRLGARLQAVKLLSDSRSAVAYRVGMGALAVFVGAFCIRIVLAAAEHPHRELLSIAFPLASCTALFAVVAVRPRALGTHMVSYALGVLSLLLGAASLATILQSRALGLIGAVVCFAVAMVLLGLGREQFLRRFGGVAP